MNISLIHHRIIIHLVLHCSFISHLTIISIMPLRQDVLWSKVLTFETLANGECTSLHWVMQDFNFFFNKKYQVAITSFQHICCRNNSVYSGTHIYCNCSFRVEFNLQCSIYSTFLFLELFLKFSFNEYFTNVIYHHFLKLP